MKFLFLFPSAFFGKNLFSAAEHCEEHAQKGYEATKERVSTARAGQELLDKGARVLLLGFGGFFGFVGFGGFGGPW